MITITVVTITFNAAKVLQPTLDSVLHQSYHRVEHLIVDGASKDETLRIAREYKRASDESDNKHEIIIQSEPDRGLYDAMNKGISRASGDYIVFLNAGDRFPESETLAKIAKAANLGDGEQMPGVIYGDTDIVDEMGNFLYHRRLSAPEKLSWRSFKRGMLVCHQAFYAKTELAKKHLYDMQYRYSADVDWCIKIMKDCERQNLPLVNVHQTVAHYLEEGQTTLHHRESLMERFKVMTRHYGFLSTVLHHVSFLFRQ